MKKKRSRQFNSTVTCVVCALIGFSLCAHSPLIDARETDAQKTERPSEAPEDTWSMRSIQALLASVDDKISVEAVNTPDGVTIAFSSPDEDVAQQVQTAVHALTERMQALQDKAVEKRDGVGADEAEKLKGSYFVERGELTTVRGTLRLQRGEWYLDSDDILHELHFGDQEYRARTGIRLQQGEPATVRGFLYAQEGADILDIAVCAVAMDGESYRFRNDDGSPLWRGQSSETGEGAGAGQQQGQGSGQGSGAGSGSGAQRGRQ